MESSVQKRVAREPRVSWSSVFAGTFVFLAIEATFGLLATAIFAPAHLTLSVGPGIWMIVLSIIALYCGAKAAVQLSGETHKLNGMYYGLVTFGLSIFSGILIASMVAGNALGGQKLLAVGAANAGWLFVTLLLGGIAAGIAGSANVSEAAQPVSIEERSSLRPAA